MFGDLAARDFDLVILNGYVTDSKTSLDAIRNVGVTTQMDLLTSSPKLVPAAVRESFWVAGAERILSDESETTLSGSDHSEVASC